jgi:hypothetical protein
VVVALHQQVGLADGVCFVVELLSEELHFQVWVACQRLEIFLTHSEHAARTTTGVVDREDASGNVELILVPADGECHKQLHNVAGRVELSGLGVTRLL